MCVEHFIQPLVPLYERQFSGSRAITLQEAEQSDYENAIDIVKKDNVEVDDATGELEDEAINQQDIIDINEYLFADEEDAASPEHKINDGAVNDESGKYKKYNFFGLSMHFILRQKRQ